MRQEGIFAVLIAASITTLFWLWIVFALTLAGFFVGLMMNLFVDQKVFYPSLVITTTLIGFAIGLVKAARLRVRRKLPDHMAGLIMTPELDKNAKGS